ncbi:MAG: M23 family metallopeptidase [Blautia sp.]|nr:M23 family metallopeptidase [Blautia sp.]MDY4000641.1 M23 family metallopeptidase [Blautia sp.]
MMKNKTVRVVVNCVMLAAVAAIGLAVFQLGTSSKEDSAPQEIVMESDETDEVARAEQEEEIPAEDAGTSQVEAEMSEDDTMYGMETEDFSSEETGSQGETTGEITGESTAEETASVEENAEETAAEASIKTVLDFSEDTLTEWPVNGNILLDYSMDQTTYFPTLDQYKLSPAIAVQAVEGAPVAAACAGKVFAIEETAQTGTTVTMELGNGYQAIYGQLTNLTVSEGDTVEKGTIIGYINAPTKYYSTEGSNLYFAMKRNGEPIDPILYLP